MRIGDGEKHFVVARDRQCSSRFSDAERTAPVYRDGVAGYERCFFTCQIKDGAGDILRRSPSSHRNRLEIGVLHALRVFLVAFYWYPSGADHVDRDAVRGELGGQASGKAYLTALGCHIRCERGYAEREDLTGKVDNAPPALLLHVGQAGSGEQKGAFDEKVQHALVERPIVSLNAFLRLVGCSVGDQDIYWAEGILNLLVEGGHLGFIGYVGTEEGAGIADLLQLGKEPQHVARC